MVLSFTLVAMVMNAQTKRIVVDHLMDDSKPNWVITPGGPMNIEICPKYIKVIDDGVTSVYDIISMRKDVGNTMVYRVKGSNNKIIEFRHKDSEKMIQYIEKNATMGNKYYYYKKAVENIAG